MVINQNASTPEKSIEKYKEAAAQLPVPSPPGGAPPAGSTTVTSAAGAPTPPPSATTVTPVGATNSGGPSLIGTSTSAIISSFNGKANPQRSMPTAAMLGLLAAGIMF